MYVMAVSKISASSVINLSIFSVNPFTARVLMEFCKVTLTLVSVDETL